MLLHVGDERRRPRHTDRGIRSNLLDGFPVQIQNPRDGTAGAVVGEPLPILDEGIQSGDHFSARKPDARQDRVLPPGGIHPPRCQA